MPIPAMASLPQPVEPIRYNTLDRGRIRAGDSGQPQDPIIQRLIMKTETQSGRKLATICALFVSLAAAQGAVVVESFESGTFNGWTAGTLNGVTTTVSTDFASDGTHGATTSFTVPGSFGGWSANTILEIDPRTIMDGNATTLTIDVRSDWSNPNGWGVYGNTIMLVLNNSSGWTAVAPTSGSLANGSFQTLTWDLTLPLNNPTGNMTPIVEAITDPGLGWSTLGIAWHVGTWAGDGGTGEVYTDNGTQTLAVDNITITSVPEPSSAVALLAGGLLMFRRRR